MGFWKALRRRTLHKKLPVEIQLAEMLHLYQELSRLRWESLGDVCGDPWISDHLVAYGCRTRSELKTKYNKLAVKAGYAEKTVR